MRVARRAAFALALTTACAAPPAPPPPAPIPPPPAFAAPRLFATNFASGPDAGPWLVAIADFDGDGYGDPVAVLRAAPGAIHVLQNVRGGKCAPLGEVAQHAGECAGVRVRRRADGRDELLILRADGGGQALSRETDGAFVLRDEPPPAAGAAPPMIAAAASPPLPPGVPEGAVTASGDLTGDGIADLLVFRRDGAWRVSGDLLLLAGRGANSLDQDQDGASDAEEAACGSDPLQADSDGDGLLDGWELHGEGGLDLPALGASPNHQDALVYLQCLGAVDEAAARAEIERAVQTWAALPVANRDGVGGIALHAIWLPPQGDEAVAKPWWQNADEQMPKRAKGLAHYIQVGPGGGGQSSELGDAGGCGANALWATFLHEFGHQVGLSHAGGPLPGMCPIYTSLMNYAYSYGYEDDYAKIHYSDGRLASLELNETRLPELLPRSLAELRFLAHGPFAFKLEEAPEGVRIDWNRDGVFDSAPVRADVTDVYGADGGVRHNAGKTVVAPSLAVHRGRLWVFFADRERVLQARAALDTEGAFGEPVLLRQIVPTGDPWALACDARLVLLTPTEAGVAALEAEETSALAAATPVLIPDSAGSQVSGFVLGGRAYALLWDGSGQPVRVSASTGPGAWGAPAPLDTLASAFPPAAVADPASGELIVGFGSEAADGAQRAWRVARFAPAADGSWQRGAERIVGGASGWYGNSRPVLLVEGDDGAPAPGRLHFIARGWTDPPEANGCWYEAITIGDASQADGWRLRRWYDEWTTTRSAVSAAFYGGDLALAYRWCGNVHGDEDDDLHVAFHGFGVHDETLSDFNDVAEISGLGLARSIPWRDATQN